MLFQIFYKYILIINLQQLQIANSLFINNVQFSFEKQNMQSPNHRGTQLMQPLINISKASTPVRKRVVQPGTQPLNSTPVNINKIPHKNPLPSKQGELNQNKFGSNVKRMVMKQNMQANIPLNNYQSQPSISQKTANLSPIMALNRKIKEGPQNNDDYQQSPYKFSRSNSKLRPQSQQLKLTQPQYHNLANSKHNNHMQSSNSFKSLLQSKSKTPPRMGSLAFANVNKKQSVGQGMKSSMGGNNFNRFKSGEQKLQQSKCYDRANIVLKSPKTQQATLFCMNNDGKKAKYKVIKRGNELDGDLLVYCSRCAIGVVQQGFSVEQITNEDYQQINNAQSEIRSPKSRSLSPMNDIFVYTNRVKESIASKIHQLNSQKNQFQLLFKKQLDDVDCYYNSIIQIIEQQRVRDRQTLLFIRDQFKKQPEQYEQNLMEGIKQIENFINNGNLNSRINFKNELKVFENYVLANIQYQKIPTLINPCIQEAFDNFSQFFEKELKLSIGLNNQAIGRPEPLVRSKEHSFMRIPQTQNNNSKQCPLRFSFQKIVQNQNNLPNKNQRKPLVSSIVQPSIQPLEQVQEEHESGIMESLNYRQERKNGKKVAFRNLFPQDESQQNLEEEFQKPVKSPTFKQF